MQFTVVLVRVVSESPRIISGGYFYTEYLAYISRFWRADERTRTAYPCSLRVITQALQGVAEACKSRISRRFPLLRVAACCTVLRSRWYQSGIRSLRFTRRQFLCTRCAANEWSQVALSS